MDQSVVEDESSCYDAWKAIAGNMDYFGEIEIMRL
jgi:hypothetical protein